MLDGLPYCVSVDGMPPFPLYHVVAVVRNPLAIFHGRYIYDKLKTTDASTKDGCRDHGEREKNEFPRRCWLASTTGISTVDREGTLGVGAGAGEVASFH